MTPRVTGIEGLHGRASVHSCVVGDRVGVLLVIGQVSGWVRWVGVSACACVSNRPGMLL